MVILSPTPVLGCRIKLNHVFLYPINKASRKCHYAFAGRLVYVLNLIFQQFMSTLAIQYNEVGAFGLLAQGYLCLMMIWS